MSTAAFFSLKSIVFSGSSSATATALWAKEQDLFKEVQSLSPDAVLRKFDDLIKLAKVCAYIINSFKKETSNVFGKESKKKELVTSLGETY